MVLLGISDFILLGTFSRHPTNGSPVYPGLHTHNGVWELTLQSVLKPQEPPSQGFLHFSLMQAKLGLQSE